MTQIINDCLTEFNSVGEAFCKYAGGAFIQSALLVLLLFAIDLLLRKRVRAVIRYGVWLLVLVKLLLPPTLALPTGIGYWLGDRLPAASPVSERFATTVGFESDGRHQPASSRPSGGSLPVQTPANAVEPEAPIPSAVLTLTPISWQAVVFLLWLVGVLAFAALLAQRVRFVKGLVAASAPAEGELLSVLDQCRRQMGVRRQVGLRISDAIASPAVCGLLRPTILMLASLVKKLSPEGLRAALIHELAHIKRGDLWVNSVQTFLQVIYFYNPFVWFANAIIRRTCEQAVDETVLVTLGGRAKDYSNTLIDIGEMAFWKADFGLRLIGVAESRKALQWRIKHMLTRPVPKSARIGVLGTIVILIVAVVLLPMARGERSNQEASATPPAPGGSASGTLVGHWTFDETSGTVAKDASGKGNDGTVVGNPKWVAGKIGGALEFDGNTYVNCGNKPSLNLRDQITMSFWFKVAAFQNPWEAFLAKGDSAYRASRSSRTGDSVLRGTGNSVHMGIAFTEYFDANSPIVTDNQWHHYASTYDGATATIYVDGVMVASQSFAGQIGDSNAYDLYIGENAQQPGRKLHGLMDDVRIYSEALNAQQVKDLMTKGTFAPVPSAKPAPRDGPHGPDKVAVTTGAEDTIRDPKTGIEFRVAGKITGESDTIVDPKTGVKFVVVKTIAGASDVITNQHRITLSPNGKFLLCNGRVVPLDGSPSFVLEELMGAGVDSSSASWSPDGQKMAYTCDGIEVLPVSAETGRPTGPPRKVLEEKVGLRIYWSADSERILFVKWNRRMEREIGTVSLGDGHLSGQPDYADFGLISPDGKMIAYSIPQDGIWVRPASGGAPQIVRRRSDGSFEDPQAWTADSQWVASTADWGREAVHFVRLQDRQGFDVSPPEEVGIRVGRSTDGTRLYFYQSSFDLRITSKVVPASGGPPIDIGSPARFCYVEDCVWSPDGASLAVLDCDEEGRQRLWSIPLAGGDRIPFDMQSLAKDEALGKDEERWIWSLSPDGKKLLCIASAGKDQGNETTGWYVVPISLKESRPTGPATLVFKGWQRPDGTRGNVGAWSLDGTKIAMLHKGEQGNEYWTLFADGRQAVRIGETHDDLTSPNVFSLTKGHPQWSPDGRMIAFNRCASDREILQVLPVEGGTVKTLLTAPRENPASFGWSSDSKEVVAACDGTITAFPVIGGSARVIVRLRDAGCDDASWLGWSPDGQRLAFYGGRRGEASRLYLLSSDTGRIAALNNSLDRASDFLWSPDSKMISCTSREAAKARPAGVLRELDVAAAVQKVPPVAEKKPAEIKPAPLAEPIAGPVFSDDFDNGPSKYWWILDSNTETSPPPAHAVENGQLMLANSSARLDRCLDWTDYIVTVRVCLKESIASGEGVFGIQVRTTPSNFGIKNRDRYSLIAICQDGVPTRMWLGINYRDVSGKGNTGWLGSSATPLVRDKWYTLEFEVRGPHLRGYLDGKLMMEATDERLSKGGVWLSTWRTKALFDDFSVRRLP
jgi:beta-lactamase regulating signal transducer with metallopeptidase domain/Tol biopolymer transport system component